MKVHEWIATPEELSKLEDMSVGDEMDFWRTKYRKAVEYILKINKKIRRKAKKIND